MAALRNVPFLTVLLPILCGIFCLILRPQAARALTLAAGLAVAVLTGLLLAHLVVAGESFAYPMGHFSAPFGNELRAGPLEALLALCFALVMPLCLLGGLPDLSRDIPSDKGNFYFLLFNLMLAAQLALIYTNDIFTAFVFIEIITIAACTSIAIRPGGKTLVATMTYLIMSLVGSSLILLAIALLYSVTGHLLLPQMGGAVAALHQSGQYRLPLLVLFSLLTVGLGIKSALFPFHVWLPGAHASATTASSSILSGLILKCYVILLIKLMVRVFGLEGVRGFRGTALLLLFGLGGLVFGSLRALRATDIKRMLSYSSVAQIGTLFVGIGLSTPEGLAAACFHLLVHATTKPMLFTAASALARASGHDKSYPALRGAARRAPLAGAAFLFGALSMVGVPLFGGFVSKMLLASAAVGTRAQWAVIIGVLILSTLLNAMYYLPVLVNLYATAEGGASASRQSRCQNAVLLLFMAAAVGLGLFSHPILQVIRSGLALF